MDVTKSTEESLLRLKDDLIADIKKLKGKSQKKKALFAAKTLAKTVFVAGTVTAALFFSTGDGDCSIRQCCCVSRRWEKYGAKYPWY